MESIVIDEELEKRIVKRARVIFKNISGLEPQVVENYTELELAEQLKIFADKANCVISSWVRNKEGLAECYNASTYDKEDDNSWGFLAANKESTAVIAAFMWLSDRGNFTPERIKFIREEIG